MSLPKPYYQDEAVTIYHGDCTEILPGLQKVDLVLTDPPYGINLQTAYRQRGRGRLADCNNYSLIQGDNKEFDPRFLLKNFKNVVLWGANYYPEHLPKSSGWLVWDKRRGRGVNDQADAELAFTNFIKGVRVFTHEWNGFRRDSELGESYHPTQKPVDLIAWILSLKWTPKGIVCDPFMGSGSTLRAAKDLGRKAIGIEIEEEYCETAAHRMAQEILSLETDTCPSGDGQVTDGKTGKEWFV
tara:strand:- start:225 stop:950 length:726 start_codon:yes stop_codon:yes gene_type:complete